MTKGIVLFGLNNTELNYVALAEKLAKQAAKFLKVPVSLITDESSLSAITDKTIFDNVIVIDPADSYSVRSFRDGELVKKDKWKNSHRDSVFYLSPYDETLVLDVDYVINSDNLNYCWDQPNDFLIYKNSFDLASWRSRNDYQYISQYSIPFYWATAFFFKKNKKNECFFALVKHIKDNWSYYNFLYQLSSPLFRNDFAFSIAIHVMNGMTDGDFVKSFPGKLYYTLDKDILVEAKDRSFLFLLEKDKTYIPLKTSKLDIHIMNKYSLLKVLK
jgi:hypothetical protein